MLTGVGPALVRECETDARDDLFGDQNNRKRYDGYVAALLDPEIWSALEAREKNCATRFRAIPN